MKPAEDLLRQLPHVDKLMKHGIIQNSGVYRNESLDAVREVLSGLRSDILSGKTESVPDEDAIAQAVAELALSRANKGVRRVINGTGVILHSNLGRACVSGAASKAAFDAAAAYSTLEYDLGTGTRGNRDACIGQYLQALTGCEASIVVNNNAAAVMLILTAIAAGGNVVVSRGELVEIGGGFRVPDIMALCGCELREIGTTNKTRLSDYTAAIDDNTRALLKVHTSNFKIVGFSEAVTIKELAGLGVSRGIPVVEDIGSGAMTDLKRYGIYGEPLAVESLRDGADVVSFSGDKLLGGPQCGIILGREQMIAKMKKHPLYRALRVDKMTVAALEATLRVYGDTHAAEREIPVLQMLSASAEVLLERAERLLGQIIQLGGNAEVVQTKSVAGGGSVPGLELASYAVALRSADEMEQLLRGKQVPIIGRIEEDQLLLDMRTMFDDDFDYIAEAVAAVTTGTAVTAE